MASNKRKYSYDELRRIMILMFQGVSVFKISRETGRTKGTIRRLGSILKRAVNLSTEERERIFVGNHLPATLYHKVVEDYLREFKNPVETERKQEKKESIRQTQDQGDDLLLQAGDKLTETKEAYEEAMVDYALIASKAIYDNKLEEVRTGYVKFRNRYRIKVWKQKKKLKTLGERITQLEKVAQSVNKNKISFKIREKLLGN